MRHMRHLPDILCAAGFALIVLALWLVSEALALCFTGMVALGAGVTMYRMRQPRPTVDSG